MFLIKNENQIADLATIIKDIEGSDKDVCLKSKEGEDFLVNRVLLFIIWPNLGALLDGNDLVMMVPLEMRLLRIVMEIKLRGFVNISNQEDVDKITEAFNVFGDNVGAEQFIMDYTESIVNENIEYLFENFEDEANVVVNDQAAEIVTEPFQNKDDSETMDKDSINTESEELNVDVTIKVEDGEQNKPDYSFLRSQDQIKRQKKAVLRAKDKCGDCKFYSRRGAIRQHILEAHKGKVPLNNDTNIVTVPLQDNDYDAPMDNVGAKTESEELKVDAFIKVEDGQDQVKRKKQAACSFLVPFAAALKAREKCGECKYYSRRGAIRQHYLEAHTEKAPLNNDNDEIKSDTAQPNIEKDKLEIKKSKIKTEGSVNMTCCNICKMFIPRGSMTSHVKDIHPERDLIHCNICEFECLFKSTLAAHMESTHKKKTKCDFCDRKVKKMAIHLDKFHSEEPNKHKCKYCDFTSFDESRVFKHIRKQHENKGGKCKKCNKTFRNITNHQRKHKVNKFECIPCNKSFSVKRDLCRHILYIHENKRNSCKFCGKTSVTNLRKHVRFNHPDMASSVEDDERLDRDRIWIQLGEAWQYWGV